MIREVNRAGVDLVKAFEGVEDGDPSTVNLDPYLDPAPAVVTDGVVVAPAGIWTVGWGHAIRVGGKFLRGRANRALAFSLYPGGLTVAQAEALLRADLLDACRDVQAMVRRPVTDNQFAALVSFAFNCGAPALRGSTLLRRLHEGRLADAAAEFARWTKSSGRELPGLVRRRAAERELFERA